MCQKDLQDYAMDIIDNMEIGSDLLNSSQE